MATEAASWQTSTLSQIAVASVGCYLVGALWVSVKTGDISSLKWAAEMFGAGYLASRGMKGANGNGAAQAHSQVPATPGTP